MELELWHLKFSLVEHQGHTLVRATHIRGDKWWKEKSHRDFDPKGSLIPLTSVESFTRDFEFQFPLPIGPKTWGRIMSLSDFPSFEDWEKLYPGYSRETYQADLNVFWRHRSSALCRTHDALWASLRRATVRLHAGIGPLGNPITPQDQAAYARAVLHMFTRDRNRLDVFWGKAPIPPECLELTPILDKLIAAYQSEVKQNKKKELAATREIAPKAKKARKTKQVEGQGTLW